MMTKRKATRQYPELEIEAASWTLHYWAEALQNEAFNPERRKQIIAKIPKIHGAVVHGTGTGNVSQVPPEIIRKEYAHLKSLAVPLVKEIRKAQDDPAAIKILQNKTCIYRVDKPELARTEIQRPLWIPGGKGEDIDSIVLDIRLKGKLNASELALLLTGRLFDLSESGVEKELQKAHELKRKLETSEVQRYLIAMFILGARSGGKPKFLLQILDALRISGYKALGLYHLSRYVSGFATPCEVEIEWKTVERVCEVIKSGKTD